MVGLALPFFMPDAPPVLRFVLGLVAAMGCFRTLDLVRDRSERTLAFRLAHVLVVVDTRRLPRGPRTFDGRRAILGVAFGVIALAAFLAYRTLAPMTSGAIALAIRWSGGLVFAYALTELAYALLTVGCRAAGFDVYELHRAPALARSVQEFWGERWNRTVSAWLAEHCMRPLARVRRAHLGVFVAFVASAILHAYLTLIAIGVPMACVMLGYFLVQGLLVLVELRVGVTKWRPAAGHAWTIGVMVATSPMFIEPMLRVLRW